MRHRRRARGWSLRAGLTLIVATSVATGASVWAAAAPVAAASSSNEPIKIGNITSTDNPALSYPAIVSSLKAAIIGVNNAGGIKGTKVVMDYCNDQVSPNVAAQCAHQMVNDHVAAVVGSFSIFQSIIQPILKAGGIPDVGTSPSAVQQYTLSNNFLTESGGYGLGNAAMIAFHQKGYKKVAIVYLNAPGLSDQTDEQANLAKSLGMTVSTEVAVSPTAADFDPTVQAVANSGAQAAYVVIGESAEIGFMKAYASLGAKFRVSLPAPTVTDGDVEELSATSKTMYGTILVSAVPPFSATRQFPTLKTYAAQMATEAKKGDSYARPSAWQTYGLQGWMAMRALASIVNKYSTSSAVTAATVTADMNKAKVVQTGLIVPWTPSAQKGSAQLPRISNPYMYILKVQGGTPVLASKAPVNVFPK